MLLSSVHSHQPLLAAAAAAVAAAAGPFEAAVGQQGLVQDPPAAAASPVAAGVDHLRLEAGQPQDQELLEQDLAALSISSLCLGSV